MIKVITMIPIKNINIKCISVTIKYWKKIRLSQLGSVRDDDNKDEDDGNYNGKIMMMIIMTTTTAMILIMIMMITKQKY